jgi:SAM-dependent methyltransferase
MLEAAAERQRRTGWSPRLVGADAFRLPLPDASVDAITIAFGIRNLRPRDAALAEMARVLRPGGVLAVLEAAAPTPSPAAPLHRLYLKRIVPLLGRLSPDPTAYRYLAESILEFGAGPEFERALGGAGFAIERRESFLFGATRLWVSRRATGGAAARNLAASSQDARPGSDRAVARETEWRVWTGLQLALSAALAAALSYGFWIALKSGRDLPLTGWQRDLALWLLGGGAVVFGARTLWLIARWSGPAPRSSG